MKMTLKLMALFAACIGSNGWGGFKQDNDAPEPGLGEFGDPVSLSLCQQQDPMHPKSLQCDDDGLFVAKQCDVTSGSCFCVDPETGYRIPGTKVSKGIVLNCGELTACQADFMRSEKFFFDNPMLMDVLGPSCGEDDGNYLVEQCRFPVMDTCACVLPETGKPIPGYENRPRGIGCDSTCPVRKRSEPNLVCDERGQFAARQCDAEAVICWCVEPQTGYKIPGSEIPAADPKNCTDELTACQADFMRSKKYSFDNPMLMDVMLDPSCGEDDGNYLVEQCRLPMMATCDCVLPETGKPLPGYEHRPDGIGCNSTCPVRKRSEPNLVCDERGQFAARQCDAEAVICWCVEPQTGYKIPGSEIPAADPKNCTNGLTPCQKEWRESVLFTHNSPFVMDGPNIQCADDGHYKRKQCVSYTDVCYCVVPETGAAIPGLRYWLGDLLDCDAPIRKRCQKRFINTEKYRYQKGMIGKPDNKCNDGDGHFKSKQCSPWGAECWCVVPETGMRLPGSDVSMNCDELKPCQRQWKEATERAVASGQAVWRPSCDHDGNFRPLQCDNVNETQCWCVDSLTGVKAPRSLVADDGAVAACKEPTCPAPKTYKIVQECQQTCDNRGKPWRCPGVRQPRGQCWCPPNAPYMDGDGCLTNHQCIAKKCKKERNEVFSACSTACDATCKRRFRPCNVIRSCTPRCGCPPMHVRNRDRVCVPVDQCKVKPDKIICPPSKVWRECGGCEQRCEDRHIIAPCIMMCQRGCTCPPERPFLDGNICVSEDDCPPIPIPEIVNATVTPEKQGGWGWGR